uniref:Guanine nucleotide-binding protein subunit beta-like protein n=1 Tax=Palpitomonas bilix TaxID=652834 RepID=A0A7S3LVW8_9EUKA|mmetsp:Transcript_50395/g.129816  ORF Transcript_50395/g.129816 Transcript_50395/m.129816 type:complete len:348 (+) Transcript_50395:255-1298(+)
MLPHIGVEFQPVGVAKVPSKGEDGVYCMATCVSPSETNMIVTTSEKEILLFDFPTLRPSRKFVGHNGPVGGAGFFRGDAENMIFSVGGEGDASVKLWDMRQQNEVSTLRGSDAELFSADINADNTVVAAGGMENIYCWDITAMKLLRKYEEGHCDDVVQTKFHPTNSQLLCTASMDGLICRADISIAEDMDAFDTILPTDISVSRIGLFGPNEDFLYCVSTNETLTLWNLDTAALLVDTGDTRQAVKTATGLEAEYLIDCYFDASAEGLLMMVGTSEGAAAMVDVQTSGMVGRASLYSGHTDIIRDFAINTTAGWVTTCGEDSVIALWQAKPPLVDAAAHHNVEEEG